MVFVKNFLLILIIMTACLSCDGHKKSSLIRYSETRGLMATTVQVDVCVESEEDLKRDGVYNKIWDRLEDIAWRMNVYDPRSEVTEINQAKGHAVTVGEDTYGIVQRSKEFAYKTRGTFLISVQPLIKLWKAGQEANRLPSQTMVDQTLRAIDLDDLELLPNNQIRRQNFALKIDLGGNAKGYAVDEVARLFREQGYEHFYIDAGGDLYVGGINCRGKPWRIGIRDPRDKSKIIETVQVSNVAVATSGNYEQFITIDNQRYSHIIDPRTGYPQKDVVSSTVIATTAEEADVYSTALTVLGSKEGLALIDASADRLAGLMYTRQPKGNILRAQSQSFKKYQVK